MVEERDFRSPQFRDAKVEDYEFRVDGAIVRKDRREVAVRKIASMINYDAIFDIELMLFSIEDLIRRAAEKNVEPIPYDEFPK